MHKIWFVLIVVVLWHLASAASVLQPACPAERRQCYAQGRDGVQIFFQVNNTKIYLAKYSVKLTLKCLNNSERLDIAAMPRYEETVLFDEVYIQSCALGNASVSSVLTAINVRAGRLLKLEGVTETLRTDHSAALNVTTLQLASESPNIPVRLEEDFFMGFQNLIKLETSGIQYDRPPTGLLMWSSSRANLKRLYAECVSSLTYLHLVEPELTDVSALSAATHLTNLSLWAPVGNLPPPPALEALVSLELFLWNVSQPQWVGAPALRKLKVETAALARLPARWLRASPRLRRLELRNLPLRELPEDLVHYNPELRHLTISTCNLTSDMLPEKLLYNNVNLEKLDLSHNNLTELPSARFFAPLTGLAELNLEHNQLRAAAGREDEEAWVVGTALRALKLDYNPLGDTCADPRRGAVAVARQRSWLRELTGLRALSLQATGATRLCADWLEDMRDLVDIDLRKNNFTELTSADLHPQRAPGVVVDIRLGGNSQLRHIRYSAKDYLDARTQKAQANVKISSKLTCDCELYLFASALRQFPEHARVWPLQCERGTGRAGSVGSTGGVGWLSLDTLPLTSLQCGAHCGPHCTCREVPALGGLQAECERLPATLAQPRPDSLQLVDLSLAGAGLAALPAADALPPHLRRLDLRNNSIGGASADEARALLARRDLRLLLAGNPLRCGCGERALVDLLLQYKDRVDFADLVCADGSAPTPAECGLPAGAAAALAALGVLSLAGVLLLAALAHPRLRARLKAALRVLGVHVTGAADAEPARRYDAFVSFAEADARWVAAELVPALEGAPQPRRLCLHYRDWAVGEFIPRQIAASVRDSRRTLLVVSDAFARSAWARAEFDEAMAVAAREGRAPPLAVLLAAPSAASLARAPALAEYLRAATYLRAADPQFRAKLRRAVPAAAPPPAAASRLTPTRSSPGNELAARGMDPLDQGLCQLFLPYHFHEHSAGCPRKF